MAIKDFFGTKLNAQINSSEKLMCKTKFDLEILQLDVVNVFMYTDLDKWYS